MEWKTEFIEAFYGFQVQKPRRTCDMVLESSGCWKQTSCDVTIIHHLLLSLFYGSDTVWIIKMQKTFLSN